MTYVEVGHTTHPVNRGTVTNGVEKRKRGTELQRGGEGRREWNGKGLLAREGGGCAGALPVHSYATAGGAGLPT